MGTFKVVIQVFLLEFNKPKKNFISLGLGKYLPGKLASIKYFMHNMSGWRKQLYVISGKRGSSKNSASSSILLCTSSYTGHDWKIRLEVLDICSITVFVNDLKLVIDAKFCNI